MTDELFSVRGKRVLVTGGTSGIGRMIVDGLAERGARIFTCSRKQASVDAVVSELSANSSKDAMGAGSFITLG